MDMLCSSLIFWSLAPFVLLDYLREKLHIHCSLHHLIVYRGQGLRIRESVTVEPLIPTHDVLAMDALAVEDVEVVAMASEAAPATEEAPSWLRLLGLGRVWQASATQ